MQNVCTETLKSAFERKYKINPTGTLFLILQSAQMIVNKVNNLYMKKLHKKAKYAMIVFFAYAVLSMGILEPIQIFVGGRACAGSATFFFSILSWFLYKKYSVNVKLPGIVVIAVIVSLLRAVPIFETLPDSCGNMLMMLPFKVAGIIFGLILWKSEGNISIALICLLWLICLWIVEFGFMELFYAVNPDVPHFIMVPDLPEIHSLIESKYETAF